MLNSPTVMTVLQKAANNWHPLIKSEVADAMPNLVVPSVSAYHSGEIQWTKGDVNGANPMSQHTAAIVSAVLTELIALLKDDDKTTVAKACEGISSIQHTLRAGGGKQWERCRLLAVRKGACIGKKKLYTIKMHLGSGALAWGSLSQHRSPAVVSQKCKPPMWFLCGSGNVCASKQCVRFPECLW